MMTELKRFVSMMFVVAVLCSAGDAQTKPEIVVPKDYRPPNMIESAELKSQIEETVGDFINSYRGGTFKNEEIAVTVIDLRDPISWKWANYRGESKYYPASVPKMFYMAAVERQLQDGKIQHTSELDRGLRDMIVVSSNDATQYIVDVITDTGSGAEMPAKEFEEWQFKRNRMNRFFGAMGYKNININQKIYCEDAYGIEQQSRKYAGENRNMLTTNAAARAIAEIAFGRLNTPERTARMMNLLKRDPFAKSEDPDDQSVGYVGKVLIDREMKDAKLWSKAGLTSLARHDVAYVEMPSGLKFAIAIFTENHARERHVIPMVAGKIIDKLSGK